MKERQIFNVKMQFQAEAENGQQIIGAVNNFFNTSEGGVSFELLGIGIAQQGIPEAVSLLEHKPLLNKTSDSIPLTEVEAKVDLFINRLSTAVRDGIRYLDEADTTLKLRRLIPGFTGDSMQYLERRKLVSPEKHLQGKRIQRRYSSEEALKIAYIIKCKRGGIRPSTAARMADDYINSLRSQARQ